MLNMHKLVFIQNKLIMFYLQYLQLKVHESGIHTFAFYKVAYNNMHSLTTLLLD